ncbi:phage major capsid protein, P2 family [Jeongeupia chitinilytica]|uniref:Phage major capsid protein, P2 family n=1 Tax=Jeongeupia chitinilytica TaxID=1041641 RepID=A0ABQ3GYI1_9NEIS|nr:phage major capsid protein, P2 family [Jeongeupia chitinilytica]GHD59891.1 phage major capsid protein, P2 family [Jeongeupia chitinilytica]
MKNSTRLKFNAYAQAIAQLNHVDDVALSFSVEPSVQQTLETKIQLSSEFLGKINIVPVTELSGEKIGLGVIGTIAGRTNTKNGGKREPRSVADLSSGKYVCAQTNFDTAIPYPQLDMWAKFPDFQTRVRDVILKQQALDRIMIGFNGTSVAATTDRNANPLLQDVNIGWLQHYRVDAPQRVMKEVKAASGKVRIGAAVAAEDGYKNLDALVYDVVNNLIDERFRDDPNIVAVMGRDLLADKYFPLINKDNPATEQLAGDMVISQKRVGGKQAVTVPFFPAGTILITTLANLSIYYQEGGRRRHLREEPDYDRVANYESSNDAYVVEVYEAGCLIENIELVAA